MDDDTRRFSKAVDRRVTLKLNARRADQVPVLFGIGMFGVIGWSVVVPTIAGALLGRWIDAQHLSPHSWTLALLVAGLVLGCANAWRWVVSQAVVDRPADHD